MGTPNSGCQSVWKVTKISMSFKSLRSFWSTPMKLLSSFQERTFAPFKPSRNQKALEEQREFPSCLYCHKTRVKEGDLCMHWGEQFQWTEYITSYNHSCRFIVMSSLLMISSPKIYPKSCHPESSRVPSPWTNSNLRGWRDWPALEERNSLV